MLLQGFSGNADSVPWPKVVISGNTKTRNRNNLGNSNATITINRNYFCGKETLMS